LPQRNRFAPEIVYHLLLTHSNMSRDLADLVTD
jgi:hypothetical protein